MEFTDRELELLSNGILRLMRDATTAQGLIIDADVYESINFFYAELRALNTKICNYRRDSRGKSRESKASPGTCRCKQRLP